MGFSKVLLIIIIVLIGFLFLYKDSSGVTYSKKITTTIKNKVSSARANTIGKAEEAKAQMESRDAKMQKEMQELEN